MNTRERTIRIILLILSRPGYYTRKMLSTRFKTSKNTIDADIKAIKDAGLHFKQNKSTHTCSILPNGDFKELRYLMPLTAEDQYKISSAIDKSVNNTEANYLKKKFYSLYDFQRLGIRALRRPELDKLDLLKAGKNQKLQVCLENYRSNSNPIRDRKVEPFYIDVEHSTLQAFDVEEEKIRHFKLNRIERVSLTQIPWKFEHRHFLKYTDVFRIADNNVEPVHLELQVLAYNALVENYPLAMTCTMPGAKSNTFDFQAKVNAEFLGLTNFIMGNRGHVKILSPNILKQHILKEAQQIIDNIKNEEDI